MNLINIAKGWYYYLKASPVTKELMEQRLTICDRCEHKKQVSMVGEALAIEFNDPNNLFKCNLCQCPLGAMSALPKPTCKAKKWPV